MELIDADAGVFVMKFSFGSVLDIENLVLNLQLFCVV